MILDRLKRKDLCSIDISSIQHKNSIDIPAKTFPHSFDFSVESLSCNLVHQENSSPLKNISTSHKQVTIMFADIVDFTRTCHEMNPIDVMKFLNELYNEFDDLIDIYNVYKVETAGDCYIVAGGIMQKDHHGHHFMREKVNPSLNALSVLLFAKTLLKKANGLLNPVTGKPIQMRIGIHTGPVVSGIIGKKMPRFCLVGDTMNMAQRMESSSLPNKIHVSEPTRSLLENHRWTSTSGKNLKGISGIQPTFFLDDDFSNNFDKIHHGYSSDQETFTFSRKGYDPLSQSFQKIERISN
jgi:class 3 adenylate cyclase